MTPSSEPRAGSSVAIPVAPRGTHPAFEIITRLRDGDRFSSTTALAILGAPLPRLVREVVHVTAGRGLERLRRFGVWGHDEDGQPLAWWGGAPVSTPERAFIEAARYLRVPDLVALGDWLTLIPRFAEAGRPFTSVERIAGRTRPGMRHIRRVREALASVRPGVESPQETALRLLLLEHGLPEPICGYHLVDRRGDSIGWFDLAWPDRRVLGEYDGDQHRTSDAQYDRDILRFDRASDAGWRVLRVRKRGLGMDADETVMRFRRALLPAA